jgi:hypothetical protein
MRTAQKALAASVVERAFLSRAECQLLLTRSGMRTRYYRSDGQQLAKRVDIAYVRPKTVPEVFGRIAELAKRNNVWGLTLDAVDDDMRIQRYVRHHYSDLHSDYDYPTRDFSKLTVVVPLVERSNWAGGDLQIGNGLDAPRLRMGDAVIFPSFLPHRVTRVTRGVRVVLSAWVSGPPLQ